MTIPENPPRAQQPLRVLIVEDSAADAELIAHEAKTTPQEEPQVHLGGVAEVVADKGYHSGEVLKDLHDGGVRSYIPEPDRGRRNWQGEGKAEEQKRTYENRRRVRGDRGKQLQKMRSELTERSFAHLYETGGMRRVHLRGHENILKRLLIQGAAFNLSLILRKIIGVGKPRQLQGLYLQLFTHLRRILAWFGPIRRSASRPRNTLCGKVPGFVTLLQPFGF